MPREHERTAAVLGTSSALTRNIINIATLGDNTIVAAPAAGNHLVIRKLIFVCNAVVNIQLRGGATNLTGVMNMLANGSLAIDGDVAGVPLPSATAFIINLSAAQQVSGVVVTSTDAD